MEPNPALIGLDWGTTNLRATLMGAHGEPLDRRSAPSGISQVRDGRFGDALAHLCGDWIRTHRVPIMASGMIGSRNGWTEAPYLACPASLDDAAQQLTTVPLSVSGIDPGRRVHIIPGIRFDSPLGMADVMRGEETQIWGADLQAGGLCVLPGTHSKWAWIDAAGRIARFRTYMTGELYSVLTQHSILGKLMAFGTVSDADFIAGFRLGLDQIEHTTHLLFAARTAGLTGAVEPAGLPDYLSGMLIGTEIGSALRATGTDKRPREVTLIGDASLVRRYAGALVLVGIEARTVDTDVAARGQWRVAQRAGLLEAAA